MSHSMYFFNGIYYYIWNVYEAVRRAIARRIIVAEAARGVPQNAHYIVSGIPHLNIALRIALDHALKRRLILLQRHFVPV